MRMLLCMLLLIFTAACGTQASSSRTLYHSTLEEIHRLHQSWSQLSPEERRFVKGISKAQRGQWKAARVELGLALAHGSSLGDYLLYYDAKAAHALGHDAEAKAQLARLFAEYPASRWRRSATALMRVVAPGRQQHEAAIKDAPDRWERRALREQWAESLLQDATAAEALEHFTALYLSSIYPDEAARARQGLETIHRRWGLEPPALQGDAARTKQAQMFLDRRLAHESVHLLESLSPPPTRALARAYFAAREYTKASPLYGQLWKSSGSIGDLQLYATASARAQRDAEAIGLQQKLAATMQGTPSGAKALYKQAYLLLDSQRYEEAMAAYQAWLERTAKSRGGVSENNRRAHWGIAWSAYRLGQWRKALAALDALDATLTKRDRLWRQRSLYWRGRVFAASNRPQEAMQIFADAHAVRTRGYYATLAALRAQGKTRTHHLFEAGRHAQSAVTLDVGALSTRAASLHAMGLWDEAIEEMDHTQDGVIGFAPRHRYAVEEIAARLTIDPALIFRLIWQESGNQPQVVSRVGAIGLMQLMPMTAQRQAQELGWENFRTTDLFRPVPNLRLGSWYLKKLLDRYEGALPFVLASYNAGEEAVDRWRKKRADHDFEEFIEAIPFSETRQYTQRILGTYW